MIHFTASQTSLKYDSAFLQVFKILCTCVIKLSAEKSSLGKYYYQHVFRSKTKLNKPSLNMFIKLNFTS